MDQITKLGSKQIIVNHIYPAHVNSYSAGIDFIRQNLTSVDVRFCRLKSIPAL